MKTNITTNKIIDTIEDKYRILFESNRDCITIFRIDSEGNKGNFIEANPATTEMFGYTKKELLSMNISDIEILSEKEKKARKEIFSSKGIVDFETVIRDKNGIDRNVEIKTVLINYENEPAVMNIARDITERKQLEDKSREAHGKLTTLLEAIPDLLFEVGMDSKIYFYQTHRQNLLAIPADQIIGKYFKDILPADVSEICLAALKEADEKGWSIGKQYSLQLPHGKHWFELSVSPINDKSLCSKRFIVLARDINARKQAEEKLIASEYLLNQTQNIAHLGSYFLDFNTGKWTSSAVLNTIFGIDADAEKTIEFWVSIVHPEWRTIMTDYLSKEVISNRTHFNKEYKIIKLDTKQERWVHGMGEINFNPEGQPLSLIGSIQDITDRKLVEKELQEHKDNLLSIYNSVSEAIYVIDQNGTFIDVNRGAEKMYQYSREELIGQSPESVSAPGLNDFNEVKRKMQSVFENGKPISFEFWAVRKNGEIFPKEVVLNRGKRQGKDVLIVTARDISNRKNNENAIRKSQEKLNNIFNLANSGIILADLEGNFLEFNNWWLKMTGYSREEFSNVKNFGITHPDDIEKSKMWLNKIYSGEIEKYQLVKRYVRKDKSIFWGESSVSAIKDKNNQITNTIGIVTDITERKLAEELLRESEEKYRGLVENSPDGIVIYVNDKIAYVNGEALRIIKAQNQEEIIGKSVLEFVHPDSLESVIQKMKEIILDTHASQIVEEKLKSFTGETVYVELKAIPTLFEHQEGVQVIIHDITERKRTQDKIKQLSQAVEQSPVAIVITNTLGNIEYVNTKFIETTGYSIDEIIGKNPRILKSGHTSINEYIQLWKTINSGNEWFGEFHNKKKDGTLYWESASISPILNEKGIITHYIAIKEDITERKNIEKQLIKAKEKAEESDRLKLAFLANMSHEIRTPMNGILGFTELLKENNLSEDVQQEYINIIEKSGKRMLNIINDIINISKVESGQIEVTNSETNINEQIEYLHTFFKPEALQKNITINLIKELSPQDTFVTTDREKLYAILTNLIKNAIKFTNEGSIDFGCEKKGDFLEFFIKDTGLGISDSQKNIIFERFRQANDTISRTHEGSGLGLAISKAYVEIQGGKIWVESEEGKGSVFSFTLPYYSKNELKEKIVIKNPILEVKEENNVKDLKVLIVEDDAISKLLITIAVKPYSKEILKVSTGFEAVETCRNNPDIDLVMMDINMPEMGGYEATKQIRKFNKDIVIIAQTANGMQSDHDKAIAKGCTDYISKPINISSLSGLIQKYFKK
ncbi:MAG TPA: PAS domain S-box protein [Flavobacterium sp.]|nr:PAS domain S-box protein [Flavobacterium sp.]